MAVRRTTSSVASDGAGRPEGVPRSVIDSLPVPLSVFDNVADSVLINERDGNVLYVNLAFEKQTGYSRDEVVGQPVRLLRAGQMPRGFFAEMFRLLMAGDVFRGTIISRGKDGSFFSEHKTITPIKDASGQLTHFIAIAENIAESQRAFEMETKLRAAEDAERFKTNLLSTISHELRTPLAAILSYTSAILDYGTELGEFKVDEYLHHIEDRSRQLERLISDLLTMSRLASGNLPMELETGNLRDVIEELIGEWQLRGTIIVRSSFSDADLIVEMDGIRIRQVLQNLLENAERYAGSEGTVAIEACNTGDGHIVVTVIDQGPGVPEDELGKIFERFYRAQSKHIGSGAAGIGLAICAAIIEAHSGTIRAYNPETGGLAVSFALPKKT